MSRAIRGLVLELRYLALETFQAVRCALKAVLGWGFNVRLAHERSTSRPGRAPVSAPLRRVNSPATVVST